MKVMFKLFINEYTRKKVKLINFVFAQFFVRFRRNYVFNNLVLYHLVIRAMLLNNIFV